MSDEPHSSRRQIPTCFECLVDGVQGETARVRVLDDSDLEGVLGSRRQVVQDYMKSLHYHGQCLPMRHRLCIKERVCVSGI